MLQTRGVFVFYQGKFIAYSSLCACAIISGYIKAFFYHFELRK